MNTEYRTESRFLKQLLRTDHQLHNDLKKAKSPQESNTAVFKAAQKSMEIYLETEKAQKQIKKSLNKKAKVLGASQSDPSSNDSGALSIPLSDLRSRSSSSSSSSTVFFPSLKHKSNPIPTEKSQSEIKETKYRDKELIFEFDDEDWL